MDEEIVANFTLEENEEINAEFHLEENRELEVTFEMIPLERDHNDLYNRDKADQHPISAITDLEARLTALENQDKNFVFEQAIASDTWTIEHNLNKYPSVMVVDSAGNAQIPDEIQYNSIDKITVTFISAFAGTAYLN